MTVFISVLAIIIGFVLYLVCTRAEFKEMGRLTFFAGVFAFCLQAGPKVVELFGR
jgi:Na+/phosphate symporter